MSAWTAALTFPEAGVGALVGVCVCVWKRSLFSRLMKEVDRFLASGLQRGRRPNAVTLIAGMKSLSGPIGDHYFCLCVRVCAFVHWEPSFSN